ncbi:MAG: YceI family protein [Pseudomonadota bacterium]
MRFSPTLLALLTALSLSAPARAEIQTFKLDNTHSFANWEIRHVVARTSGTFHDVQGKVVLDTADIAKSSVEASISVYSLNSSHLKRDIHVLTEDYLGARDYPEMKFVSTKVNPATPEKGTLTGTLTLHGVTKPVSLDYQILGLGKDPWGGTRIGFKATTQLKRADFGMGKGLPYGPVGNEVDITLLIEGIRITEDGQTWKAETAQPKVISFPAPAESAPQPVPVSPTPAQPAPAPATPEKKESTKDQLKRELLKGLFN